MRSLSIAARGIKWSSISQIFKQLLQYLTTLILVSFLAPSDFGLITMSLIVTGFLEIFKDLGTASAIIQREENSDDLLSSIFWVNILVGVIISSIIFAISPYVAEFFNQPEVTSVMRVLSLTFIISSISILHKSLLEKRIEFDKLAKIEIISSFFGGIVAITLAINGFKVWSIVFQYISVALVNSVLLLKFALWSPKFYFSFNDLKQVKSFSLNLIAYNIINYFIRNFDYVLIGKFLGDKLLGHYYLAYRIMLYPVQNISVVISRVMFPVYSRIQNNNMKIKETYSKIAAAIAFITFPISIIMISVSNYFVQTFFDNRWDVGTLSILLIILAPVGLIQSITVTTGSIYLSKGRTDWLFRWGFITGIISIVGFLIGLEWGIVGIAVSYLIVALITTYHCFVIPFKLIELNFFDFILVFNKIVISCLLMFITTMIFKDLLRGGLSDVLILIILCSLALSIYFLINLIINKVQIKNLVKFLKSL